MSRENEAYEHETEVPLDHLEGGTPHTKPQKKEISAGEEQMELLYSLEDNPSIYLSLLLGIQQYLTMIGATIVVPFSLIPYLCISEEDPARGALVSTIIFVSGIVTLLQVTFGIRLPIVQGGTFAFLVPSIVTLKTSFTSCSKIDLENMTSADRTDLWQERMRTLQGAVIVASFVQVFIGLSGIIGLILSFITPLAIVPTIALIGLALFPIAVTNAGTHWGISLFTMFLMIIFSQYMRNVHVPIPSYSTTKKCYINWVRIFNLFPVLFSITISWGLCWLLTYYDVLPKGSKARTDTKLKVIQLAPWFRVPYPFQWGVPIVNTSAVLGIIAGVISSMIESVGDYYACARLCGATPPPTHAINRGILMEGLGCILAGIWGTGNGTTSYSENIAAIGITKVGSRRVIQSGALVMLLFGVIGKFGAVFATLPTPILGALFCIMFSITTAIGLSSLQFVNLNSSRNIFILGFSLFMGLALPNWLSIDKNKAMIATGVKTLDQIIIVLLQTSMFVGGFIGFFLDNTVPGTIEERGLDKWRMMINSKSKDREQSSSTSSYDLPFGMAAIRRISWLQYIPIMPTFQGWGWLIKKLKRK